MKSRRIFSRIKAGLIIGLILVSQTIAYGKYVNENRLEMGFDRNVETVGIVLSLSDLGAYMLSLGKEDRAYTYIGLHRKYFQSFKDHPAVLKVNSMAEANLVQFGHYMYGVYFTQFPEFQPKYELEDIFFPNRERTDSVEQLYREWNQTLRQFYQDAEVEAYLHRMAKAHHRIELGIDSISSQIPLEDMGDFFGGTRVANYRIIPSFLVPDGFNFGPTLDGDSILTYCFVAGPTSEVSKTSSLDSIVNLAHMGFEVNQDFVGLSFHEFGHSHVRFTDQEKYRKAILDLDDLNSDSLQRAMESIGQSPDWLNVFEEHFVRACEIVIWRAIGREEEAQSRMIIDREEGFEYINTFVACLESYNLQRDRYSSLSDYFPNLIKALEQHRQGRHKE